MGKERTLNPVELMAKFPEPEGGGALLRAPKDRINTRVRICYVVLVYYGIIYYSMV